jgi:hypothetical protein
MRIALTLGFCLVSAATTVRHSKSDAKPEPNGPVPAQDMCENYRSGNVVTIMAVASSTTPRKFSMMEQICASSRRDVAKGRGVKQANIGQAVNLGGGVNLFTNN